MVRKKKVRYRPATVPKELKGMYVLARWMDTRFILPGSHFQFGLDGILGLIPGVGDLATFFVSGYLVLMMARNGASGFVLARMIFNIVLDAALGAIPVVGDLFDFVHKANTKNMKLMEQYYVEGRHRGGAWKVVVPVLLALTLVLAGICWLLYRLFSKIV
jgi:hypothetical protein